MSVQAKITGLLTCRRCKGTGSLPSGEPCPRCSTEEGRAWGDTGSGVDPDSYAGCMCGDEEHEHD